MKRFYVYHNPNFLDREVVGGYSLELVAAVDGNDIEDAFHLTNNIDGPWFENDNVIACYQGAYTGKGCRSTSVWDVVIDDGIAYICDSFGWKKDNYLTKWYEEIGWRNTKIKVQEMEKYLSWLKADFELPDLDAEEDYLPEVDDVMPVFTFDVRDNVADEDIPF